MRSRVAERRPIRSAVDADLRHGKPQPACSERISRPRWNRSKFRGPPPTRWLPPGIPCLESDHESTDGSRIARTSRPYAEDTGQCRARKQIQAMPRSPDDDDRAEIRPRAVGLDPPDGHADEIPPSPQQSADDEPDEGWLDDSSPGARFCDHRVEALEAEESRVDRRAVEDTGEGRDVGPNAPPIDDQGRLPSRADQGCRCGPRRPPRPRAEIARRRVPSV